MGMFGNKTIMLGRDTAMSGFPIKLPIKKQESKDGKLHVTVEFLRPRWQQLLGSEKTCDRTFKLDEYGREVFEACNSENNVNHIINQFAENHKISIAEAEVAVSTFLKSMMSRGMIAIKMQEPQV